MNYPVLLAQFIAAIALIDSESAQPSQVPVLSIVRIPTQSGDDIRIMAVEASSDNKRLAILLRTVTQEKTQNKIILFDEYLQPFRVLNAPPNVTHFALDEKNLYYTAVRTQSPRIFVACSLTLSDAVSKCMDLPAVPEELFLAGGLPHYVSGGDVFALDIASAQRRMVYHYTHVNDNVWTIASSKDDVLFANGLTGKAFRCHASNWTCAAMDLLSPEQRGWRGSKHPDELFFDKLTYTGKFIYVLGGRYQAAMGFRVNLYSPDGQFLRVRQFAVPKLSESGMQLKTLAKSPADDYLVPSFLVQMASKLLIIDSRTMSIVVYEAGL